MEAGNILSLSSHVVRAMNLVLDRNRLHALANAIKDQQARRRSVWLLAANGYSTLKADRPTLSCRAPAPRSRRNRFGR